MSILYLAWRERFFPWSERLYLLESNFTFFVKVYKLFENFNQFENQLAESLWSEMIVKYFYLVLNMQLVSLLYTYKHTTLTDVHRTFLLKICLLSVANSISRCNTVRVLWWELLSSDDLIMVVLEGGRAWEKNYVHKNFGL